MKILQIGKYYPPVNGGIETQLKILCEGLAKKGHEVTCAVSSTDGTKTTETINGVKVIRFSKLIRNFYPVNLKLPLFILKNKEKFDIVHVHTPNPCAELSALLAKPKNLIVSYHADIVGKPGTSLYLPLQEKLLEKARAIIVSSVQYANESPILAGHLHKCVAIPYGIDFQKYQKKNAEKINELRKLGNPPYFLFVGRLVQYKGIHVLLEAMKRVEGTLFIVGKGSLQNTLQRAAKAAHLDTKVHFFTNVGDEDLTNFYNACDIFVLPSINRAEAFGIVQLEAMACAKPTISTAIHAGMNAVTQDGITGIVVPKENAIELARALSLLGEDKRLRDKLGMNAKRLVMEKFTDERMVKEIERLYRSLLP